MRGTFFAFLAVLLGGLFLWATTGGVEPGAGSAVRAEEPGEEPDEREDPELESVQAPGGDSEERRVEPDTAAPPEQPASPEPTIDVLTFEDADWKVWPPEPVGPIRGWLRPESGAFRGDADALLQGLTLDLVSNDGMSPVKARARFTPELDDEGRLVAIAFETDPLPPISFELTLSSLDQRRWSPVSTRAVPPAEGIEFLCYDADPGGAIAFEVVDAETGEAVTGWTASQFKLTASEENGVLLHAGPLDLEVGSIDGPLQWIVEANGYAPAFGSERSFDVDPETGARRARVEMRRGFATRLVVLGADPDRVPAADGTVWLDGRVAGRTGNDGALVVSAAAKPEEIEVVWRDQEVSGTFDEVCLRRRSHLHVVLLEPR